jgi:hypothetical protein
MLWPNLCPGARLFAYAKLNTIGTTASVAFDLDHTVDIAAGARIVDASIAVAHADHRSATVTATTGWLRNPIFTDPVGSFLRQNLIELSADRLPDVVLDGWLGAGCKYLVALAVARTMGG